MYVHRMVLGLILGMDNWPGKGGVSSLGRELGSKREGGAGRKEGHVTEKQFCVYLPHLFVFVGGFGQLTEGFYLCFASSCAVVCEGFVS